MVPDLGRNGGLYPLREKEAFFICAHYWSLLFIDSSWSVGYELKRNLSGEAKRDFATVTFFYGLLRLR